MELSATMTGNPIGFLQEVSKATDKAAIKATNDTAFDARATMSTVSLNQGAHLEKVRISKATASKPEARIRSIGWQDDIGVSDLIHVAGGSRQSFGGTFAAIPGHRIGGSGAKLSVAQQHGFLVKLKSGKTAYFMRQGKARLKINLLYTLRPQSNVPAIVNAGVATAAAKYEGNFDKSLNAELGRV